MAAAVASCYFHLPQSVTTKSPMITRTINFSLISFTSDIFDCASLLLSLSFMTNHSEILCYFCSVCSLFFFHCLVISWQPIPLSLLIALMAVSLSLTHCLPILILFFLHCSDIAVIYLLTQTQLYINCILIISFIFHSFSTLV